MPRANVRTKIAEQKGFLERSVADYLDGHTAEAMRLALSIRVLVHETARQTPLLKMFRTNYLDLEILDNIHAPPPRGRILLRLGLGFNMSNAL